ncbi:MAG TPA: hypothetical protein VEG39_17540 [Clostridia bacterium]|nr:hypothetical protein [Clostridia bacterium]
MHDTFLVKRISEALGELFEEKKLGRITKLRIITSKDSHIRQKDLYEHLLEEYKGIAGEWTEIIIEHQDIESLTAIIESVEGDILG